MAGKKVICGWENNLRTVVGVGIFGLASDISPLRRLLPLATFPRLLLLSLSFHALLAHHPQRLDGLEEPFSTKLMLSSFLAK